MYFSAYSPTTKEHVVPRWLADVLPAQSTSLSKREPSKSFDSIRAAVGTYVASRTVPFIYLPGCVWWLQQRVDESTGRPGKAHCSMPHVGSAANPDQLEACARRCAKTALMLELTHPDSVVANRSIRDALSLAGVVPGTMVMLGFRETTERIIDLTHTWRWK